MKSKRYKNIKRLDEKFNSKSIKDILPKLKKIVQQNLMSPLI